MPLAKPNKLHPVEKLIQLPTAGPRIARGITVLIPCLECD